MIYREAERRGVRGCRPSKAVVVEAVGVMEAPVGISFADAICTPATSPDAHAVAKDATAPTPPSPPNVAADAQMASANEAAAGASTTTAFDGLQPLTPLLSASL